MRRPPKSVFEDDVPGLRVDASRDYLVALVGRPFSRDDVDICPITTPGIDTARRGYHHLRVTATSHLGCDTGRRRYRVECLTCGTIVHEATTGAYPNMQSHVVHVAEDAAQAFTRAVQALVSGAE